MLRMKKQFLALVLIFCVNIHAAQTLNIPPAPDGGQNISRDGDRLYPITGNIYGMAGSPAILQQ